MKDDIKKFSLIWSVVFIAIGFYPLLYSLEIRYWSVILAAIFIIIAFTRPMLLKQFYRIWIKIGEIIGGVISKMILFILYFGLFTPISYFLKFLGKDLLNKKSLNK